jgi:hypothetical protein
MHTYVRMKGGVGEPHFYHRVSSEGKEAIGAIKLVAPASHLRIVEQVTGMDFQVERNVVGGRVSAGC